MLSDDYFTIFTNSIFLEKLPDSDTENYLKTFSQPLTLNSVRDKQAHEDLC